MRRRFRAAAADGSLLPRPRPGSCLPPSLCAPASQKQATRARRRRLRQAVRLRSQRGRQRVKRVSRVECLRGGRGRGGPRRRKPCRLGVGFSRVRWSRCEGVFCYQRVEEVADLQIFFSRGKRVNGPETGRKVQLPKEDVLRCCWYGMFGCENPSVGLEIAARHAFLASQASPEGLGGGPNLPWGALLESKSRLAIAIQMKPSCAFLVFSF